jgi:hypothetical protein
VKYIVVRMSITLPVIPFWTEMGGSEREIYRVPDVEEACSIRLRSSVHQHCLRHDLQKQPGPAPRNVDSALEAA